MWAFSIFSCDVYVDGSYPEGIAVSSVKALVVDNGVKSAQLILLSSG